MTSESHTRNLKQLRRDIGARIHNVRVQKRVTLKRLSSRTGIPVHRLDYYELGGYDLSLGELERIAKNLGLSASDLLVE